MTSYNLNSSGNLTLWLANGGTAGTVYLTSYTVKDTAGNSYSSSSWAGTSIAEGRTVAVIILTSGSVSFQTGHDYSITVVTSKSHQFTYGVTV
jgi:kynureninase